MGEVVLRDFSVPLGIVDVGRVAPSASGQGKATEGPREASEKASPRRASDPRVIDLLRYFLGRFEQVHGYAYKANWPKEANLMRQFFQQYGADARPMIDYLFDVHGGCYGGSVQTTGLFAKNSGWLLTRLRDEWKASEQASITLAKMDSPDRDASAISAFANWD